MTKTSHGKQLRPLQLGSLVGCGGGNTEAERPAARLLTTAGRRRTSEVLSSPRHTPNMLLEIFENHWYLQFSDICVAKAVISPHRTIIKTKMNPHIGLITNRKKSRSRKKALHQTHNNSNE